MATDSHRAVEMSDLRWERRLGKGPVIRGALALLCGLGLATCDAARDPGAVTPADPVAGAPAWTLSDVPDFSVSESADFPAFQLHMVRYGLILDDASVVVANIGSGNLVYLDPTGRALRVVGGEGEGPGEFASITGLFSAEDGVGVWDQRSSRVSLFSARGDARGELTIADRDAVPVGLLPGEGVVTRTNTPRVTPVAGEPRLYTVWTESRQATRTVTGPVEPGEIHLRYTFPNQIGGMVSADTQLDAGCVPRMIEVSVGSSLYIAEPGAGVVSAVDASGAVADVYRSEARQPITEEMRERLRTMFAVLRRPPPADSVESVFRQMGEVGDPLPAWEGAVPDPSGRLWLERSRCFEPPGPTTYDVIDTAGVRMGTVTLPPEWTLLAARGDRVLVVRRDELDVEHVELYRISRQAPRHLLDA
jgi:hypothetical protein